MSRGAFRTEQGITAEGILRSSRDSFLREITSTPYFRIAACVQETSGDLLDTDDENLRSLLRRPPGSRSDGWIVRPDPEPTPSLEGISNPRDSWHYLSCERRAVLEFGTPIDDTFCWQQPAKERAKSPRLYPYAVVEYPVSFLRLWHALLAKFVPSLTGSVVHLEFLNCAGCHLRPGHPGSIAYRSENLYPLRPWREPHLELPFRNLPIDFEPDFEAYELACRIYAAFGFEREAVPLFDKDRRFTP